MSSLIAEDISKIQKYLDLGEFYQANKIVRDLETQQYSDRDDIRLNLYKSLILLNLGEINQSVQIITKIVNSISDQPKSIQLEILQAASQVTLSTGNNRLTRVYIDKFLEIYSDISSLLQDKTKSIYADVINVEGLLEYHEQNFEAALHRFEETVKLQRKLNKPYPQAVAMFNAGKTANELKKPARSELFLVDALALFRDIDFLVGQLQCVEELVTTYRLQSDDSSVISFTEMANQLRRDVELHKLQIDYQKQMDNLRRENQRLHQQLIDAETQITETDRLQSNLEHELFYLRDKLEDYEEIKVVYSKLKGKIEELEDIISNQKMEISQLNRIISDQKSKINKTEQSTQYSITSPVIGINTTSIASTDLEQLISSSKLIDAIYTKLVEVKSAKVRILALQTRISTTRCIEALQQLENVGAISIDSWNFASPTVTLIEE